MRNDDFFQNVEGKLFGSSGETQTAGKGVKAA